MQFSQVSPNVLRPGNGRLNGFTLKTNTVVLTHLMRWMKYESIKTQKDPNIVIPFVRKFGAAVNQNFRQEKWPGTVRHDWAPLTEYTNAVREERGYNAIFPIMKQSGQLHDMSSTSFREWRWGQKSIRGKQAFTPYGDNTSLTMTASINNGDFNASISGERVKNQQAYHIRRKDGSKVGVPPRPFWGLTYDILEEAMPSALEQFNKSWASRKNAKLK